MKSRAVSDMETSLKKKGFLCSETHHAIYWFHVGERKTSIRTRFSQGMRECDIHLLAQVRKQIKLNNWDEFNRFMDCPMGGDEYLRLMRQRGHVDIQPS